MVAPVITHVSDAILPFGSEYVAVRPEVISISHDVALVLVSIGAGQVIGRRQVLQRYVTVLLVPVTGLLLGSVPVTVAVLVMLVAVTSAAVTV